MKILEIQILTDDIKATEKFYTETLGFHSICKDLNSISFSAGYSVLTFKQSHKLNPTYHFAFNIPNNKLEESINWITEKLDIIKVSGNSIIANFADWNAKAIYFYDNNRNILEFITRYDLNNSTDKTFDGSSIQSISEIAIVTDNVAELTDQLIENYKISLFPKQKRRENFTALGNDNGLLIISQTNRNWYPTDQPAKKYFTKIKMQIDNKAFEIIMNEKYITN